MKDQGKTDQLLRDKMANFRAEVSEASKYRFLSEAPRSGNGYAKYILTTVVVLVVFSAVYIYSFLSDRKQTDRPTESVTSIYKGFSKDLQDTTSNEMCKTYISKIATSKRKDINNGDLSKVNETSALNDHNEIVQMEGTLSEQLTAVNIMYDSVYSDNNIKHKSIRISNDTVQAVTTDEPMPGKKPERIRESKFRNNSLYLYYNPEIIWNIIENEKLMQGFGIGWQTHLFNNDYIIGTGIGLLKSKGYYQYKVDYNEYLGNYQRLDSISFTWNASEFSLEQTRHTSNQVVYDTVVISEHANVYRDFQYLQIPFTLGYDFIKTNRFSAGLRFSPVFSVLLSNKPVDFKYDPGINQLIQINRITADRVKTNWQLRGGLSFTRSLGNSLFIEIEPQYIYYFNSVYEKSESKSSPYGASVRIALGIKY